MQFELPQPKKKAALFYGAARERETQILYICKCDYTDFGIHVNKDNSRRLSVVASGYGRRHPLQFGRLAVDDDIPCRSRPRPGSWKEQGRAHLFGDEPSQMPNRSFETFADCLFGSEHVELLFLSCLFGSEHAKQIFLSCLFGSESKLLNYTIYQPDLSRQFSKF